MLSYCWTNIITAFGECILLAGTFIYVILCTTTQLTRAIHTRLVQCWASVVDGGPALNQPWVNVSCLLGRQYDDGIYIINPPNTWALFIHIMSCLFTLPWELLKKILISRWRQISKVW